MWSGVGAGVVGAGLKIGGGIHGDKSKAALKRLEDAIREDIAAHSDLIDKLQRLQRKLPSSEGYLFIITIRTPAVFNGFYTTAQVAGIPAFFSLMEKYFKPLVTHLCKEPLCKESLWKDDPMIQEFLDIMITFVCGSLTTALTEISEPGAETASKIAAEAVKTMEEGFIKKQAYQAALKSAEEILKAMGAVANQAVKEVSSEVAKTAGKLVSEAAKQSADDVARVGAQAALKSAEELLKSSSGEALGAVANQAVKEFSGGAVKTAGKLAAEAAKQSADDVARVAARAAAENTATTLTRVAGGITVGLGAVFIAWDVYNIAKDSKKISVGVAIREIADNLENQLDQQELRD